jgi:hypothetical protein
MIPSPISTKVVGVSFNKEYPHNIFALSASVSVGNLKVDLEREIDNPSDSSAIKVIHDGKHLGYLPMLVASSISSEIDAGTKWNAEIEDVLVATQNANQPGLKIFLWRN